MSGKIKQEGKYGAERIDLLGYCKAKQTQTYVDRVPSGAYAYKDGSFDAMLNVDRLPQTDVIDVLRGSYNNSYRVSRMYSGLAAVVDIAQIVQRSEGNVVALAYGKGEPFGTGLLIHPHLVLTTRHCIEERDVSSIGARIGYQKSPFGIMDFGIRVGVNGIVEENSRLDYIIIELKGRVTSFSPIYLEFGKVSGSTLFIHHPGGGPKKCSVHTTLGSDQRMWDYGAFHDSQKGSSGGVYINAAGRICALHCLKRGGVTSGQLLSDIYPSSKMLQYLFNDKGMPNIVRPSLEIKASSDRIFKTNFSTRYHEYLEVIERKPEGFPSLNTDSERLGKQNLTYHHIIPKANLEFLWMLGKEYQPIERHLKKLAWPCERKTEVLIVNAVIWAPWNLFIGPNSANRIQGKQKGYDPKDEFSIEPLRPRSFNNYLWTMIVDLNDRIEKCWNERGNISSLTRVETIKLLDDRDGKRTLGDFVKKKNLKHFQNYSQAIRGVSESLALIYKFRSKNQKVDYIHRTKDTDWTFVGRKNGVTLYRLGGSKEYDYAEGLMDSRVKDMAHLRKEKERLWVSRERERQANRRNFRDK